MDSIVLERETIQTPVKRDLRRLFRRLALAVSLAALASGSAWYAQDWWSVGRFIESTDDAYVGGDITVIAPKVAGLIAEVKVTDNQPVHAGDLLVKLDDRDYRAALARADGAVAAANATLVNLEASRRLQDAVIAQAKAEIAAADAEVERAEFDLVRYRHLASDQVASVQRLQQADADRKKGVAVAEKARALYAAAQRQLDVIAAQKQQAEAALAQAIAERDLAQLNLGYTEIRAPIDGWVGNRTARAGAFAPVGAQLLALVPAHGLWVDANFKESQLAHMRQGLAATVMADELSDRVFHGQVASLAPATGAQFSVLPPENATGNFTKLVQRVPVRIALDPGDAMLGALRPGLSTTVSVDTRPAARRAR
jgi:membrane fusion protein, multidrug efflux system